MQIQKEKIIHTDVLIIGGGNGRLLRRLTLRSLSKARWSSPKRLTFAAAVVWQPASTP